ncbi:hypothetical protein CHARACLAT_008325 [Characodon lateralis]|uniref:Uncharacterized protein n=1 Tax=Characodon lateralis TaxID=208331 RepID=A0ABU7E851_9TELE|nr:hypothetical protein [Characodon lateralis]
MSSVMSVPLFDLLATPRFCKPQFSCLALPSSDFYQASDLSTSTTFFSGPRPPRFAKPLTPTLFSDSSCMTLPCLLLYPLDSVLVTDRFSDSCVPNQACPSHRL